MKSLLRTILCLLLSSFAARSAEVVIRGLEAKAADHFQHALEPRLHFISARPASSWRADDAAFYLNRLLLRRGYAEANVTWSINSNTITLDVVPGPRFLFGSVTSNQKTTLDSVTLTDYFYQPLVEGELANISKAPYIEEYTDKGIENVENYLKSTGYWNAHVTLSAQTLDKTSNKINVLINIDQGPLHTLSPPTFSGISAETKLKLLNLTHELVGQTATTKNIVEMTSMVTQYFRKSGYHFSKTTTTPSHENRLTTLHFDINQGQLYTLRDIIVHGYEDTEKKRISRQFKYLKHKAYDANKADKATTRLLTSGVFKKVIVTPVPYDNGYIDLDVEVEEGDSVTVSNYIGMDSYEGIILGLAYTDLNFQGKMRQLSTRAEYSQRGLLWDVGITEPYFMGEILSFTLRGFALKRRPEGYQKSELGTQASWSWHPLDHYDLRAYTGASFTTTTSGSMTPTELGPTDYTNFHIGLRQSLDLRDNPILPTDGYNGQLITEFTSILGKQPTTFFKLDMNHSYRHSFNSQRYFISRFDFGFMAPTNPENVPIDVRFFSGGPNSVRSFPQRELGPRSLSGDPLGGETYWVGSAEIVQKIKGPLHAALFYDIGQLSRSFGTSPDGSPSQALGIGARIHLPIGPIRFEYGYNLNRKKHEPRGTFHFTIGASF